MKDLMKLRKKVMEIQALHFCEQKISFKVMEKRIQKAYKIYKEGV